MSEGLGVLVESYEDGGCTCVRAVAHCRGHRFVLLFDYLEHVIDMEGEYTAEEKEMAPAFAWAVAEFLGAKLGYSQEET